MRLNRAMIYVNDLPRMTAFYGTTLGLKVVEKMDDYVEFDTGASRFALHAIPLPLRCDPSLPVQAREKNPIKLSFEVENVELECNRLEGLGVTIVTRPWGSRDGIDPEGNIFGIYSPSM
jgi:catechol 2,3-dioxygenase-like lactoylglutathione lyase family enzyme